MIYEEFTTVVILQEQMHVADSVWHNFLQHLWYGQVQQSHIEMLCELVITNHKCPKTDFSTSPWNNVCLIMPCHAVQKQWNKYATQKYCRQMGGQLFICTAEDTIRDRPLTLAKWYGVAMCGLLNPDAGDGQKKKWQDLPEVIEIAISMKVMVTQNVKTDLDITNGARGEIVDIILHPDEPPVGNKATVKLKYLPSYILVKLCRTCATQLDGLEESVIPVEVSSKTFKIHVQGADRKFYMCMIQQWQFPMTAAFGFTDYRSQGQTIPFILVDIASPPTRSLSLFNMYVALSCSSSRETIWLLRDFDDQLFQMVHETQLLEEDDRLESLDHCTKEWWAQMKEDCNEEQYADS